MALAFTLSCQSNLAGQKRIFLNQEGAEVSEREFDKIRILAHPDLIDAKKILDSTVVHVITKRRINGLLDNKSVNEIYKFANDIDNDMDKMTLIFNYYPGRDECNSTGSTDINFYKKKNKRYQKLIRKDKKIRQFYIYKDDEGLELHDSYAAWWKDPDSLFERLFFEFEFPCGGHIIIDKNRFMVYYGESYPEQIFENIEDFRKLE